MKRVTKAIAPRAIAPAGGTAQPELTDRAIRYTPAFTIAAACR